MSPLATILLSTDAAIGLGLMVTWVTVYGLVFAHLGRNHPNYYEKIGQPSLLTVPQFSQSWLLAWEFMIIWTLKNLPASFPHDPTCRRWAIWIARTRIPFAVAVAIWIVTTSMLTAVALH
jgi:hypothetical protein